MANLKDIRNRIKSVKSIEQVTKAMKMVAAAKMRRAQENMEQARPYSSTIMDLIHNKNELHKMGLASRGLGRPDATNEIVNHIFKVLN